MNKAFFPYGGPQLARDKQEAHHMNMPPVEPRPMPVMKPMKLARAYVLSQPYTGLFPLDVALRVGTVFPNLFEAFPEIR